MIGRRKNSTCAGAINKGMQKLENQESSLITRTAQLRTTPLARRGIQKGTQKMNESMHNENERKNRGQNEWVPRNAM